MTSPAEQDDKMTPEIFERKLELKIKKLETEGEVVQELRELENLKTKDISDLKNASNSFDVLQLPKESMTSPTEQDDQMIPEIFQWKLELKIKKLENEGEVVPELREELENLKRTDISDLKNVSDSLDVLKLAKEAFAAAEKGEVNQFKVSLAKWNVMDITLNEYGNVTPLHWAALHGQTRIVKVIVEWIVDSIKKDPVNRDDAKRMINARDKFGFTPLHLAMFAGKRKHSDITEIVKILVNADSGRLIDVNAESGPKKFSFPFAASRNKLKVGEELTDPDDHQSSEMTRAGLTPLHLATLFKVKKDAIEELLHQSKPADPLHPLRMRTSVGESPLHFACMGNNTLIITFLLDYLWRNKLSDLINIVDYKRRTPLHYAVMYEDGLCVQFLLLRGVSIVVNATDTDGKTPLDIIRDRELKLSTVWKWRYFKRIKPDKHDELEKDLAKATSIRKFMESMDPATVHKTRQVYVDAANAILVGAALIASASFGAWLQPPLGYVTYYSDAFLVTDSAAPPGTYESFAALDRSWVIQLFWIFNSLAFFLSIATVIAGLDATIPRSRLSLTETVYALRKKVLMAAYTLFSAIICVIGTFTSIGFGVLPPLVKYQLNMFCTMIVGFGLCLVFLCLVLKSRGSH